MAGQEPDGYWAALAARSEALDALWETQVTPSPGGWSDPDEPPQGVVPRPDRVPWWVRVWYYTPFLSRSASAWMWTRGGFDVLPRSVRLPPLPEEPPASAASVVLPLSGERVCLSEMRWQDPEPGLLHTVGGTRITRQRRFFNQRWVSHVSGVRPTPAPVAVRLCRLSRWRFLRRSRDAEVVYGAQGLWAAEASGRWDVVEVSHAGRTRRTNISPGRLWEFAFPRPKPRSGESGTIFGPG
jgi:hypothetical protein